MKYDEYLAAGYPIGSGVVEGACRHLVKDRMEQAGMRWRIAGAQAILSLRAIYVNDDWEALRRLRCSQALTSQGLAGVLEKALPAKRLFFSVIPWAADHFFGFLDHKWTCAGISCDV